VRQSRSCISLIGFCLMTAIGTALLFALVLAGGSVALASHEDSEQVQNSPEEPESAAPKPHEPQPAELSTFSGMITDSYCGARHRRFANLPPAQCAATCIRSGAHFVLVDGDRRYILSGSGQSLGKLLGTRANVTGTRDGDTIVVSSAAPMF
jgi:hypothetical protein